MERHEKQWELDEESGREVVREERKKRNTRAVRRGGTNSGAERNLTLGSRECSGHSTWSRLQ